MWFQFDENRPLETRRFSPKLRGLGPIRTPGLHLITRRSRVRIPPPLLLERAAIVALSSFLPHMSAAAATARRRGGSLLVRRTRPNASTSLTTRRCTTCWHSRQRFEEPVRDQVVDLVPAVAGLTARKARSRCGCRSRPATSGRRCSGEVRHGRAVPRSGLGRVPRRRGLPHLPAGPRHPRTVSLVGFESRGAHGLHRRA
jgi:hypothetical protein